MGACLPQGPCCCGVHPRAGWGKVAGWGAAWAPHSERLDRPPPVVDEESSSGSAVAQEAQGLTGPCPVSTIEHRRPVPPSPQLQQAPLPALESHLHCPDGVPGAENDNGHI